MIIIGDQYIPYPNIQRISSCDDIKNTAPNSFVLFSFDKSMMQYCMQNDILYIVEVYSLKEAIYANSLNCTYLVSDEDMIETIQKVAENYLFDTKILAKIQDENEIENIAKKGIDGVIYNILL